MKMLLLSFCVLLCAGSAFSKQHSIPRAPVPQSIRDTVPQRDTSADYDMVFTRAEIAPQFSGGEKAWRNFLMKNMNASTPVDNGVRKGKFTVYIQFIVEKDGSISDVKPLTQLGYGLEEECMRLMKISPRWEPAKQNGRAVRCYHKQSFTFIVSEG